MTPGGGDRARASWWFDPVPLSRIARLRVIVYLFIPVDVALGQSWIRGHARLGSVLYHPLFIERLLHLPTPTERSTTILAIALVLAAATSAFGLAPRVLGAVTAILYLDWMLVAMSYGKVDHDRFAFLVTLAVLPTIGSARWQDRRLSVPAAWSLRCIQIAVVLTYFYAAWAKIRFGGWNWPTGAILERALLRRSTPLSHWLIDKPHLLVPMQFAMIGLELLSPLVLLARSDRARTAVAIGLWGFHITVFAGVTIIFLPHCIAICAFIPWERVAVRAGIRRLTPERTQPEARPDVSSISPRTTR